MRLVLDARVNDLGVPFSHPLGALGNNDAMSVTLTEVVECSLVHEFGF